MAETESVLSIQDEDDEVTASVVSTADDIAVNGIVALNADGSSVNPVEEEE